MTEPEWNENKRRDQKHRAEAGVDRTPTKVARICASSRAAHAERVPKATIELELLLHLDVLEPPVTEVVLVLDPLSLADQGIETNLALVFEFEFLHDPRASDVPRHHAPYFHNVRANLDFGLNHGSTVRGRAYLALSGFSTLWLCVARRARRLMKVVALTNTGVRTVLGERVVQPP